MDLFVGILLVMIMLFMALFIYASCKVASGADKRAEEMKKKEDK